MVDTLLALWGSVAGAVTLLFLEGFDIKMCKGGSDLKGCIDGHVLRHRCLMRIQCLLMESVEGTKGILCVCRILWLVLPMTLSV